MTEINPEDRVLDWEPKHDPKSREFPIRASLQVAPRLRNKLWKVGPTLNQGREGACVGFGWTAEALTTPVPVDLTKVAADIPRDPTAYALSVYKAAQKLDNWEGEDYSGTSVLAGAKVLREHGLIKEFRWAFSVDDVINTILSKGPVVLGIEWRSGMYSTTDSGVLLTTGKTVGGHCITAVGFEHKSERLGGEDGIILQNSWGNRWGKDGLAVIKVTDLAELLSKHGEACVASKRSYGRSLKW